MKNFKKGFTLVEMLIVVVIIGILAAALLPRLLSAQASARDSARMSALQQIATATAAYLQEKGDYPISGGTKKWGTNDLLAKLIENGSVTSLPDEPQKNIQNEAVWGVDGKGKFTFAILKKNGIDDGAIVFAAKMERAWNANYVLDKDSTDGNVIDTNVNDSSKLFLCKKMTKANAIKKATATNQDCEYKDESQLYYVGVY